MRCWMSWSHLFGRVGSEVKVSVWEEYGSSDEGAVFKPVGSIVNVNGRHSHEAYIVISNETWVGFWFPYEQAFSPLAKSVPIILSKRKEP